MLFKCNTNAIFNYSLVKMLIQEIFDVIHVIFVDNRLPKKILNYKPEGEEI